MSNRSNSPSWLRDGNIAFFGGVDASVPPSDIARTQLHKATNCTMRGGPLAPRPGWKKRVLSFADTAQATAFRASLFQHGAFYASDENPSALSSHGGRLFSINLKTYVVDEITPDKQVAASTTTILGFNIPAVANTQVVLVTDTSEMDIDSKSIEIGGYPLVLVSIDGLQQITVANYTVANVGVVVANPATVDFFYLQPDYNSPTQPLGWSVQGGNYWIFQDNQSLPVIYDGSASRRSNIAQGEIPVGNVMAYAQGRLIVALPDRHTYRVGDLLFGPSGTATHSYKDAILKFTENNYLSEGGDMLARVFGAPSNDGPITAMKAVAMPDTQLGQGPLMIGTPYNVFTVNLPFDRTTWKDLTDPLQTNSPLLGPTAQDSMVLVNTDVWYRAIDGIRSYIMGRRQLNSWGFTAMSSEIWDVLGQDTEFLLEHGSGVLFDNRLLTTMSPCQSVRGVFHRGLAVMDFHLISTMSQKLSPVWEGVWSGLRILKIIKGLVGKKEHCYAYVLNSTDEIEFWELTTDSMWDGDRTPINWAFELPSYNCGNSDQFKRLETLRGILNGLVGTLTWAVSYRSDQNPCYTPWDNGSFCAKYEDCCYNQTTTVDSGFALPAALSSIQITVSNTSGMSVDFPELTIGGYVVSLVSVDTPGASGLITVRNDDALQAGGLVPDGTTISFCGFDCAGPHTYREQPRLIRLHSPPDVENEITGHYMNRAYEFQPMIELSGYAKMRQVRIFAKDEPEMLGVERQDDI